MFLNIPGVFLTISYNTLEVGTRKKLLNGFIKYKVLYFFITVMVLFMMYFLYLYNYSKAENIKLKLFLPIFALNSERK